MRLKSSILAVIASLMVLTLASCGGGFEQGETAALRAATAAPPLPATETAPRKRQRYPEGAMPLAAGPGPRERRRRLPVPRRTSEAARKNLCAW